MYTLQGSALHEHLSNLGYTDFESVAIPKKPHCEQKTNFHIVNNFSYTIYSMQKSIFDQAWHFTFNKIAIFILAECQRCSETDLYKTDVILFLDNAGILLSLMYIQYITAIYIRALFFPGK